MTRFERDGDCSVTITVQFYFVVEQGCLIAEEDIKRAIDVCEEAYKGCVWDGNLMDPNMSSAFAKKDMSWTEAMQIKGPSPLLLDSTLTFPESSTFPALIPSGWPSPPQVPFASASFSPLDGLDPELKMQVAKVPLQQEGTERGKRGKRHRGPGLVLQTHPQLTARQAGKFLQELYVLL